LVTVSGGVLDWDVKPLEHRPNYKVVKCGKSPDCDVDRYPLRVSLAMAVIGHYRA
jgi:hypothetical protein